ncbi:hypothetical protein Agub_g12720 [Astrephomene gubernaculifera]|uniref:Uncharacterized protein n=1 Tax=Astrephomene gubernaculifera TaxID=47775 RepID=A0AAD3HRN3_9CHLO|nr:hypothetical protein Agub_g12720 [Astrephomene gubernaculifera]
MTRSFLHKGGDVFVDNYLEEKEMRAPAAQLLFVSYLVELTRPKGHEIGAVGDYFWLQKPWLKKKKELEGVLAAGNNTAQVVSSVLNRRFTPTVSSAHRAQDLKGASSIMHEAATAPSSQTVPWQVSGHDTLPILHAAASSQQCTADLSRCTSPVLQEDANISLWDMEPNEDSLVSLEASLHAAEPGGSGTERSGADHGSPGWILISEASLRAAEPGDGGTERSGADHRLPSRRPSSEVSLRGAEPGGSGTERCGADHRSPNRSPSPEASLRGSEPGGSGTERSGADHRSPNRRPSSELPCMQASLHDAEPGGSGTERRGADYRFPSRSPSSEASLRAAEPGGSGTKRCGADHRSPSRIPSSEASLRAAEPGGSGTERSGADHRSPSRIPSSEVSLRAAEPGGGGTERSGADHRSPSRIHSSEASLPAAEPDGSGADHRSPIRKPSPELGGCKRPVQALSPGTEHTLQGGGLRYNGGRQQPKKARRRGVSAYGSVVDAGEALDDEEEIPTISKAVFTVDSPSDIPEAINESGVAILHDPGIRDTVTPAAVQRALQHGGASLPIFESIPPKRNGRFVQERRNGKPTGYLRSTFGSKQRRQCLINPEDPDHADVLADFRGVVEPKINEAVAAMGDDDLELHPPYLLLNTQSEQQEPVRRQGNHTDLKMEQKGGVAIAAVQKMGLLLYPESNRVLERYWQLEKLVDEGGITPADLEAWVKMRKFKAVRVELEAGDIIFLSGHMVHAGDCGMDNYPSLRVHWYFTDGKKENETTHLVMYGAVLAAQFV